MVEDIQWPTSPSLMLLFFATRAAQKCGEAPKEPEAQKEKEVRRGV